MADEPLDGPKKDEKETKSVPIVAAMIGLDIAIILAISQLSNLDTPLRMSAIFAATSIPLLVLPHRFEFAGKSLSPTGWLEKTEIIGGYSGFLALAFLIGHVSGWACAAFLFATLTVILLSIFRDSELGS